MITYLLPDQIEFVKSMSSVLYTPEGTFYYMPFYLKEIEGNQFERITFDQLPKGVIDAIKEHRGITDKED